MRSVAAVGVVSGSFYCLNFGPRRSQAVPLLSEGRRGRLVSSKKPVVYFLPVGCGGGLERATCLALGLC